MVNDVIGDLITFPANIIAHQTNFDGIMGGGVAYYIANTLLSSYSYDEYRCLCARRKRSLLGKVQFLPTVDVDRHMKATRFVANMFCQDNRIQPDGGITRYDCMERCLKRIERAASKNGFSVAVPGNVGCGIAGGNWERVRPIIESVFMDSTVPCTIVWRETGR